jgi:AsmA protein
MTRVWKGLGLAAILVGLAAVALMVFAPVGGFKAPLEARVSAATGRAFHIEGPLSLTFTPELALDLGAVTLGAGQGPDGAPLVTAKRAVLAIALLPLVSGNARATGLTLEGADIAIGPDGSGWTFAAAEGEALTPFDALDFGNVRLIDSVLRIGDVAIEARDLQLRWPAEGQALSLSGDIGFREKTFAIDAVIERRDELMAGGRVPLRLEFASDLAEGSLDGVADLEALGFQGGLSISAPSARALAAFLGAVIPGDRAFGELSLSAAVRALPGEVHLRDAKFALGAMTGGGALAVRLSGNRPSFSGSLSIDRFALNDWLAFTPLPDNGGWRDAAFDLSGLSGFDADLTIKARTADLAGLQIQNFAVTLSAGGGRLWARIDSALAYAAILHGTVTAAIENGTPTLALTLSGEGFDTQSILAASLEGDGLTGRANLKLDLTAKGATRRALIDTLSGSAGLVLIDGAMDGLDPAALARTAADESGPKGLGVGSAIAFKRLAGTFQVQNGRARTTTLRLVSNTIRADGAGAFDLGARTMAVRISPVFTADVDGTRDHDNEGRIAVPFAIVGPWAALTATPDWPALMAAVRSGKVALEAIELLPEPRRSWFKNLIATGEAPPWPEGIEKPDQPSWLPW